MTVDDQVSSYPLEGDSELFVGDLPIWKFDPQSRELTLSAAACEALGFNETDARLPWRDFVARVHAGDRKYLLDRWLHFMHGHSDRLDAVIRVQNRSGQLISLELRGKVNSNQRAIFGSAWTIKGVWSADVNLADHVGQLSHELSDLQIRQNELEQTNEWLKNLATRDGLTGLHNHRSLQERLSIECSRSDRGRQPFSILMIDVDRFKGYNDEFGHPAGDSLLADIANHLVGSVRLSDFVARYGGEEFAIILPDTDLSEAEQLAERVRVRIATSRFWGENITASFGCAEYIAGMMSKADLIHDADRALYRAKRAWRNCVRSAEKRGGAF